MSRAKIEEKFYAACGEMLGMKHNYVDSVPQPKVDRYGVIYMPATKATRWGGREPGNGRYPGFGTIRLFGNVVQIRLTRPKQIFATIDGLDTALEFLKMELE